MAKFYDRITEISPNTSLEYTVPVNLISDNTPPEAVASLTPIFAEKLGDINAAIGYTVGATELSQSLNSENTKEDSNRWAPTSHVIDVKVFFRNSHKTSAPIGSKARIIFVGKDFSTKKAKIEAIDTGFVNSDVSRHMDGVFQRALARTVFSRAAYCIGGAATIRKRTTVTQEGQPYRTATHANPAYTEDIDRREFDHVLHGAVVAAGAEIGDFTLKELDNIFYALILSRSMDELAERLKKIEFGDKRVTLVDEDIRDIEEASVVPGVSNEQGVSLVQLMRIIAEVMDVPLKKVAPPNLDE